LHAVRHHWRDESFHAVHFEHERCGRLLRTARRLRQRQGAVRKVVAILDCVAETRDIQIAGMSLLDRLIVISHRAGCAPIYVIGETMPPAPRARALGIDMTLTSAMPEPDQSALLIKGGVLVETADLQQVIERGGQLFADNDTPLPVAM